MKISSNPLPIFAQVLGVSMNVGVLSVPNDRLAICERLQVGRQPLGREVGLELSRGTKKNHHLLRRLYHPVN